LAQGALEVGLERYILKEERPWGTFRVHLLNRHLESKWAADFFEFLAKEYHEAQRGDRLHNYMKGLLSGPGSAATVKILSVNPRSRLSLQYHMHRAEEWFCLRGEAVATLGAALGRLRLSVGSTISVPKGTYHRLESEKGAHVLEVSRGFFDEDDIVRVEDDYARVRRPGERLSALYDRMD
jgi:mannose-6-phosphate isomerase